MFSNDQPSSIRKLIDSGALDRTISHYALPTGPDLLARTEKFSRWIQTRIEHGVWDFTKTLKGAPLPIAAMTNQSGNFAEGINFASQDYLSLSSHPAIHQAAAQALHDYGPHSAGSAVLMGNTESSLALEGALADWLQAEHITLFPTGWGAGYGVIKALVRADDFIVMDELVHACLQDGACAATRNIVKHAHLNMEAAREAVREIRSKNPRSAILVISEGLFSMDSDMPDIQYLQQSCREFGATLIVDVAHDIGALGPDGTGVLGLQKVIGKVDLVMGAFSKTFAANGGFVATHSPAVKHFIKAYGGPHTFSNALSPIQTAVIAQAIHIIRSSKGEQLRKQVAEVAGVLRSELSRNDMTVLGAVSPIVPVHIGPEGIARLAGALAFEKQVFVNQIEFPAVAIGSARFRMQCMASHSEHQARQAGRLVSESIREARALLGADGE
jgi:7-keto-8-aminopelargonate synthetase-like enzyme